MKKYLLFLYCIFCLQVNLNSDFFFNYGWESYQLQEKSYYHTDQFAKQFAQANNLRHVFTGAVVRGRCSSLCSFALMSHQELLFPDAQKLMHSCVKNYILSASQQPNILYFFSKFHHGYSNLPRTFNIDYVGVRINFWTKEMDRVQPPYIAEMRFFNNTYHYYHANPETQELVLIHEEPYDL